jgi:hypothetical protein
MRNREYLSRTVLTMAVASLMVAASAKLSAAGQAPQASSGAATPALQPYTAPDQSAQAGVPPGWKVVKGGQTVVQMTGPNGETISLGQTFVVRNAPLQLGQQPSNGVDLSMPNSANLADKFTMLEQWGASLAGAGDPQVHFASSAPIQLSIPNVQCGRGTGTMNSKSGQVAFGLLICSLPVDTGGTYKLMFKRATAPPNVASQEAALAGAVFASYRVPSAQLQLKFAPHTAPPPPPQQMMAPGVGNAATAATNAATMNMMRGGQVSSDCMDLGVIREEPNWQLPQECGGRAPNP